MRNFVYIILLLSSIPRADLSEPGEHFVDCPVSDSICEKDRIGFEAIRQLHRQIDDDQNGNLDRSESDEFIRDELKYEDGFDRHSNFHGNDDLISVDDLWKLWIQSDVYNWTVDDVADWVVNYVELPQYLEHIKVNAVDGHTLPRNTVFSFNTEVVRLVHVCSAFSVSALYEGLHLIKIMAILHLYPFINHGSPQIEGIAGNSQYVTNILGIKNLVHRQKLSLKAMDLVLFGAPKSHNYVKDLVLVASLLIACGGCWLAYVQHRYSQGHLKKVMKDLDTLRRAEEAFAQLQLELEEAHQHKERVEEQKQNLEKTMENQIKQAQSEADRLRESRESNEEEMTRLRLAEEELLQVRSALRRAEKELKDARMGMPLAELQSWLQLTYEIETKHYDTKREAAERQLLVAKEMCEKIRKKRSAFLGSLRIAHTTSIDDTDHMIMSARAALEEVKMDLQERSQRWQQIETICGFLIRQNPGQICLEALLRSTGHSNYTGGSSALLSNRALSSSMVAPLNVDDADEDLPPGLLTPAVAFYSDRRHPRGSLSFSGMFRPEPRVWPHLMRAGMQLTMFGLGLTNSQAMHTLTAGMPETKAASLASGLGGSSSGTLVGGVGGGSRPRPPLSTIPSQDSDSENRTDSEDSSSVPSSARLSATSSSGGAGGGAPQSAAGGSSSGGVAPVTFDLGGGFDGTEDDSRQRANSVGRHYRQSCSLDSSSTQSLPRPRTLPTSLSDGAFKNLPTPASVPNSMLHSRSPAQVATPTAGGSTTPAGSATPTMSVDDNSSPESTDGGPGDREKRKKKKNVFKKILGREKHKTS